MLGKHGCRFISSRTSTGSRSHGRETPPSRALQDSGRRRRGARRRTNAGLRQLQGAELSLALSRPNQKSRMRGCSLDEAVTSCVAASRLSCVHADCAGPVPDNRLLRILLIPPGVRARFPRIAGAGRLASGPLHPNFAGPGLRRRGPLCACPAFSTARVPGAASMATAGSSRRDARMWRHGVTTVRMVPRSRDGSQGGTYIHRLADRVERAALAVLRLLRVPLRDLGAAPARPYCCFDRPRR